MIKTCASCGIRVIPRSDGTCPSCQRPVEAAADHALLSEAHPTTAKRLNWYLARDHRRRTNQVVIQLAEGGATDSKFGTLVLAAKYEFLNAQPWCAGYFRADADAGPFLLVRADGNVEHLRRPALRLAFSFYRLPAGGLFGIFVEADAQPLRLASPTGQPVIEGVYGLDVADAIERMRDALARDVIHMCFADASRSFTHITIGPSGGSTEVNPPECRFDRVFHVDSDCRRSLLHEFDQLLKYHAGLSERVRSYQRSMQELAERFPAAESPILGAKYAVDDSDRASGKKWWQVWG
jgi:hypothetical protein